MEGFGFFEGSQKRKKLILIKPVKQFAYDVDEKNAYVVKCQFLVTLIGKLHHFTFTDPIKIHEKIKVLSKL